MALAVAPPELAAKDSDDAKTKLYWPRDNIILVLICVKMKGVQLLLPIPCWEGSIINTKLMIAIEGLLMNYSPWRYLIST